MKVAFYVDNRNIPDVDFSDPTLGNPGSGAAEYLQVAIPYALYKYTGVRPIILAHSPSKMPELEHGVHVVGDVRNAAMKAKELGVHFFVFRPRQEEELDILNLIEEIQLPSIGIAALTPFPKHLRKMAATPHFKALVCVGRQQYDFLVDTPVAAKRALIDNGVFIDSLGTDEPPEKDERLVCFMGALTFQKSFHVLAKAWPLVLKKFPDARLAVLGSAKLYNRQATLGPLGLADERYEKTFASYVTGPDGEVIPSITFHGNLGPEKKDILRRALVGVVNPTGQTETCCVSAVEFAAAQTAVVSGRYYALIDAVEDGETGLLGKKTPESLAANICALLADPERAKKMGVKARRRAIKKYPFDRIAHRWREMLFSIRDKKLIPKPTERTKNLTSYLKGVRMVNSLLQRSLGQRVRWPTVYEAERAVRGKSH